MKTVTIKVPDSKYRFFVELLDNLGLNKKVIVEDEKEPGKKEILSGLRDAVNEVNQVKRGKKKIVLLKDFLNEL